MIVPGRWAAWPSSSPWNAARQTWAGTRTPSRTRSSRYHRGTGWCSGNQASDSRTHWASTGSVEPVDLVRERRTALQGRGERRGAPGRPPGRAGSPPPAGRRSRRWRNPPGRPTRCRARRGTPPRRRGLRQRVARRGLVGVAVAALVQRDRPDAVGQRRDQSVEALPRTRPRHGAAPPVCPSPGRWRHGRRSRPVASAMRRTPVLVHLPR